jgi:hypothetical protein
MSLGCIVRIFACVLLLASLSAAQHVIAAVPQLDDCSGVTASDACLPEAPSATRGPSANIMASSAPIVPARKLSPAERRFVPLSNREKFDRFTRAMYSPYTIFNAVYDATWAQAEGSNYRYGGGMEGWGNRIGAAAANAASQQFFGKFLFPALLNQDPRYFAMYHGPVWKRIAHAASRTVLTKGDNGHTQVNYAGFLAIGAAESLENTWLPANERSVDKTLYRMLGSLQGAATSYLLREFTPDIVHFFKGHSPRRLRRLEDKIPEQMLTGIAPGEE